MNIIEILGDKYKDDMTADELIAAISEVELPNNTKDDEVEQLKRALTKSNKEASEYKKQLKEKMSEEELAKTQREEEIAELEKKYKELLHTSQVNDLKAELIEMGYEGKLAEKTAVAMVDGDTKAVMEYQKTHVENLKSNIKAEILKDTPKPTGDGGAETMTLEKLKAMDIEDRMKFANNNPEAYRELYSGGN